MRIFLYFSICTSVIFYGMYSQFFVPNRYDDDILWALIQVYLSRIHLLVFEFGSFHLRQLTLFNKNVNHSQYCSILGRTYFQWKGGYILHIIRVVVRAVRPIACHVVSARLLPTQLRPKCVNCQLCHLYCQFMLFVHHHVNLNLWLPNCGQSDLGSAYRLKYLYQQICNQKLCGVMI